MDVAAEIFRQGLRHEPAPPARPMSKRLDYPLFVCEASKANARAMPLESLLELEPEAEAEEDARRARGTDCEILASESRRSQLRPKR